MIKLQAHLWAHDRTMRAAYLDWKYDRNPYSEDTHIYVAFYDKKLVGMVGAYGVKWQIGDPGQTFPGLCFADLVIHPRHRHRNLFPKLMTFALNDLANTSYEYVFDLSAAAHVALNLLMQGWRSVFIQTANRATTPKSQDNERSISRLATTYRQFRNCSRRLPMVASTYNLLHGLVRRLFSFRPDEPTSFFEDLDRIADRSKTKTCVALSKTPRPVAMAELAERIGTNGRIRHVRDEKYFSWRFQNPLSEYRFLFWEKGQLDGYVVLHTKSGPYSDVTWAYIVDWEVTNEKVWSDLLQTVIQWGNFAELYIWTATLSEDMKSVLKKFQFIFSNKTGNVSQDIQGENILVKPLGQKIQQTSLALNGRNLLNTADWDLRMIYSDAY